MRGRKLEQLQRALADQRGRRVVFVSHCLLNENVRYLGGGGRRGSVDEVVDGFQAAGVGMCQMPCPEQRAWGGVAKRYLVSAYGSPRVAKGGQAPAAARCRRRAGRTARSRLRRRGA